MRKFVANSIGISVIALAAGCTSFQGSNDVSPSASERLVSAPKITIVPHPLTVKAREQLKSGMIASCIDTYGAAMRAGEPDAPINNGLGVAYAKLGRLDLAARFFKAAMLSDASDYRYVANYARVMDEIVAQDIRLAAVEPKTREGLSMAKTPMKPSDGGRIRRVSRGEVHIKSQNTSSRRGSLPAVVRVIDGEKQNTVTSRRIQTFDRSRLPAARPAAPDAAFKPIIRVTFSESASTGELLSKSTD